MTVHRLMQKPKIPAIIKVSCILNALLSALCFTIMGINKWVLHLAFPYINPFNPFRGWVDFNVFRNRFQHFHHLDVFSTAPEFNLAFMYPAPASLLYEPFYLNPFHSTAIYLCVNFLPVFVLAALFGRAMVRHGIGTRPTVLLVSATILFSYPFWFEFILGNVEISLFLIIAIALIAFMRGHSYLAAGLIGVAASMKIFPFVYLALFLSRRKYREIFFGIGTAVALTVISLWLLCPSLGIAIAGISHGIQAFRENYMLAYHPMETGFDHTLLALLKQIIHVSHPRISDALLNSYLVCVACFGFAIYYFYIRHLPLLNQVLCLCITSILLPPVSHDYTLIHLYVPWGLLVLFAIKSKTMNRIPPGLPAAFLCFAILFSAQSEVIYKEGGWSGQIKALTLLCLLIIALRNPWEASSDEITETMPDLGHRVLMQS